MKKVIVILLITMPIFASECYKSLCKDDKVMDIFGWSGFVTSFDEVKDMVEVELAHGPGTYSFPYAQLGKSVECFEKICVEDKVIDKYNEVDIVLEIYTHGKARVYSPDRDGEFIMDISTLIKY